MAQVQADLATANDKVANLTAAVQGLVNQRNKAQSERDNFELQVALDQQVIAKLQADLKKAAPAPK